MRDKGKSMKAMVFAVFLYEGVVKRKQARNELCQRRARCQNVESTQKGRR